MAPSQPTEDRRHARWPGCRRRRWRSSSSLFFVVPLALDRDRQLLGLQRVRDHPGLHGRSNYVEMFEGCLDQLPDLCTTCRTYLSTLKFCLHGLGAAPS